MVIDAPARVRAERRRVGVVAGYERDFEGDYPFTVDLSAPPVLRRMSFAEYLRLPEKPKSEYVDGMAVIHMVPPLVPHSSVSFNVAVALARTLPKLKVLPEGPLRLNGDAFQPDIMVVQPPPLNARWILEPPVIIVEILSASTRKYDLTTKSAKYLAAGVGQFWTVDTDRGEIVVRQNAGKSWNEIAVLDEKHPVVTVVVPGAGGVAAGTVELNRTELFS